MGSSLQGTGPARLRGPNDRGLAPTRTASAGNGAETPPVAAMPRGNCSTPPARAGRSCHVATQGLRCSSALHRMARSLPNAIVICAASSSGQAYSHAQVAAGCWRSYKSMCSLARTSFTASRACGTYALCRSPRSFPAMMQANGRRTEHAGRLGRHRKRMGSEPCQAFHASDAPVHQRVGVHDVLHVRVPHPVPLVGGYAASVPPPHRGRVLRPRRAISCRTNARTGALFAVRCEPLGHHAAVLTSLACG